MNKVMKYQIGNVLYRRDELSKSGFKTKRINNTSDTLYVFYPNGNVIKCRPVFVEHGQRLA